ncbi:hypothetical protein OESDEN_16392 [Oesophagostomum dentatum]|uniref:Uncharacterized protein n=1 Tax=Oesophagostomum dentatum TaxID=61180 RepID=A0A0B1SJ33_OESDE|nr:hypothetical protein OESDEN_16392 [Oesophagostomum dentatum]
MLKDIIKEISKNLKEGEITVRQLNQILRHYKVSFHTDVRKHLKWICNITGEELFLIIVTPLFFKCI